MTCTRRSICIAASIAHFALTHNALLAQSLFMALRPPGSATFRPAATSGDGRVVVGTGGPDRKSTRLNSSHLGISYAVFCWNKKKPRGLLHSGGAAEDRLPPHPVFHSDIRLHPPVALRSLA